MGPSFHYSATFAWDDGGAREEKINKKQQTVQRSDKSNRHPIGRHFRHGKQFNERKKKRRKVCVATFIISKMCAAVEIRDSRAAALDSWLILVCVRMLQITGIISPPFEASSGLV